jgi:hypothetical protein
MQHIYGNVRHSLGREGTICSIAGILADYYLPSEHIG